MLYIFTFSCVASVATWDGLFRLFGMACITWCGITWCGITWCGITWFGRTIGRMHVTKTRLKNKKTWADFILENFQCKFSLMSSNFLFHFGNFYWIARPKSIGKWSQAGTIWTISNVAMWYYSSPSFPLLWYHLQLQSGLYLLQWQRIHQVFDTTVMNQILSQCALCRS